MRIAASSRAILAGVSFAAFAGAFVTTPIVVRGAADPPLASASFERRVPAPPAGVVLPRRDPFAGDAPRVSPTAIPFPAIPGFAGAATAIGTIGNARTAIPGATTAGAVNRGPSVAGAIGALPPNAGAPQSPFALDAPSVRVTAVVTGAHPFALVDEGGTTRLVTVGDRVTGDVVAAINGDGVRLAHGAVLAVERGSSSVLPSSRGR